MSHEPNQTMPFYRSGLGNSAAYQVSGAPYVASGTNDSASYAVSTPFPRVTSEITISATGGDVDVDAPTADSDI